MQLTSTLQSFKTGSGTFSLSGTLAGLLSRQSEWQRGRLRRVIGHGFGRQRGHPYPNGRRVTRDAALDWTSGATPHKGKSVAPRLGKRGESLRVSPVSARRSLANAALRDLKRLARKCSVYKRVEKREDIAARIAQDNPGGSAMLKQLSYKAKVEVRSS